MICRKTELQESKLNLEKENANMRTRLNEIDHNIHNQVSRDAVRELDKENLGMYEIWRA